MPSKRKSLTKSKFANFFIIFGLVLIGSAVFIAASIYLPLIRQEVSYEIKKSENSPKPEAEAVPVDTNFGLVIEKIGANVKVIENVDPFNSEEYQLALSKGVAHAKGTALPGETGNIFLFSHSSANFGLATRYNSIFYLLNKLEAGDEIVIYYQNVKYTYVLQQKLFVKPEEISYLSKQAKVPTLTLMTCWPPGTTLKRLIAIFTILTPEKTAI